MSPFCIDRRNLLVNRSLDLRGRLGLHSCADASLIGKVSGLIEYYLTAQDGSSAAIESHDSWAEVRMAKERREKMVEYFIGLRTKTKLAVALDQIS
jgi:hypothetical protein